MKSFLLARLPLLLFGTTYLIVKGCRCVPGFHKRSARPVEEMCRLAIEAGAQGWNAIELKELHRSATEYLGPDAVEKVVIDKSQPYLPQVKEFLSNNRVTHYLYDPRTGRQDYWGAFTESVRVAIQMARYRVVPVVYLTDLSYRLWRCQAAAVSAINGVVVTFMMPKQVQPIFPHRRLAGPSLMPFSVQTLDFLEELRSQLVSRNAIDKVVRFTGSLYEPRTTILNKLREALAQTGHRVEILGRELGSARVEDEEYWTRLNSAAIVITTADQAIQSGTDWTWIPHLVYRYLEVLASGSLLLASTVPGVARYFESGKHFVAYESPEDAIQKARYYLDNPMEAEKIRAAGHAKAAQLIRAHTFWVQIDTALGYECFST